jgi:hypothetical protein
VLPNDVAVELCYDAFGCKVFGIHQTDSIRVCPAELFRSSLLRAFLEDS